MSRQLITVFILVLSPIASAQEQPKSSGVELMKRLRTRHLDFMRREIVVEKHWTEDVYPQSQLDQAAFADMKFGIKRPPEEKPRKVPKPYKQPHRVRKKLYTQGNQTTIKQLKELEKIIHPEFGWKFGEGAISSNVSGEVLTYHPPPMNRLFRQASTPHSLLLFKRYAIEVCLGFGHLRDIKSVSDVQTVGERTVLKGTMVVMERKSEFKMELDKDLIVRRIDVAIPANGAGFNRYVGETSGTVRPKGGPPVAKQGRCRRIVEPVGGKKRTIRDDTYRFVSISGRLTKAKYAEAIRIDVPKNAMKTTVP